jgi:hypothetical protein
MLENRSFPPAPNGFAAVLAVKGALPPRQKNGAPLTAAGRRERLRYGGKAKTKKTSQSFLRRQGLVLVLRLCPVFHQKISRQDLLPTTISTSIDP